MAEYSSENNTAAETSQIIDDKVNRRARAASRVSKIAFGLGAAVALPTLALDTVCVAASYSGTVDETASRLLGSDYLSNILNASVPLILLSLGALRVGTYFKERQASENQAQVVEEIAQDPPPELFIG